MRLSQGAWELVPELCARLFGIVDPLAVAAESGAIFSEQLGVPTRVLLVAAGGHSFLDSEGRRAGAFPPGLESLLRLESGPVALKPGWVPGLGGADQFALGLGDATFTAGMAIFASGDALRHPALAALAALCGTALQNARRHHSLQSETGANEHTRHLQQQILDHVSHEFNTPLMILRSSSQFAREAPDGERELFFDMHEQALDRLEELVRGVIEVAHAGASRDRQEIGLKELARSLVSPLLEDPAWGDQAPLFGMAPSGLRLRVEVDALGLSIEHLLRNAREHGCDEGARVAVSIFPFRMDSQARHLATALRSLEEGRVADFPDPGASHDAICIEVADSGPGIPPAELELIFEPFTQASNSPLRGVSGAGMGLATSRELIESIGGRLEVESELGAGSLFRILLPAG